MCYFVRISHRFADARVEPLLDDNQDISDAVAMLSDGVTVITFTRSRNSDDSQDISLDAASFLLLAWGGPVTFGTPNSIGYHENRRVSVAVNFPSATDCPSKQGNGLAAISKCFAFTFFNYLYVGVH